MRPSGEAGSGIGPVRVLLVLAVLGSGGAALADTPILRLDLEAGSELDTNVHREAGTDGLVPTTPAAGGRLGARAALSWRASRRHALRLRGVAVGKAFAAPDGAAAENVAVFSGDARWESRLTDTLGATAFLSYFDAIEDHGGSSDVDRDFRTGDASGALSLLAPEGHRLTVNAGYRLFLYKPNPAYDFAGEHAGLTWRKGWQRAEDAPIWDVAVSYNAHRRRYKGGAYLNTCPPDEDLGEGCLMPTGLQRIDLFHAAAAELTWTSTRILGARYELQIVDSNSHGQSFVRHRLDLSATTEIANDFFMTAKVVAQLNSVDLIIVSGSLGDPTIEDESRNAFILHFTREVREGLTLEARGAYYTSAFTNAGLEYHRATVYLGAVYSLGGGGR